MKHIWSFALSFLQLYMDEDDCLFEVLLQLTLPSPAKRVELKPKTKAFEELHYDHLVLLDYLISKDTGIHCVQYLLRCLRTVSSSWCMFVEYSLHDVETSQLACKKREFSEDGSDSNGKIQPSPASVKGDVDLGLLDRESKKTHKSGSMLNNTRQTTFENARECLLSLKRSVENLHHKNLFPYNPSALLRSFTRFLELCHQQEKVFEGRNNEVRMAKPISNWERMLKGWIPAHLDGRGTHHRPAHSDHLPAPPKWRGKAQFHLPWEGYDIDDRVYDLCVHISLGQELFQIEEILDKLDELQAYAEDIDVVQVLHSDCVLSRLLPMLYDSRADIRAKTAEVVTTIVQNNPTSQQVVIEGNGLQLLVYNLTSDPDATSRTKALAAISALLRNNKLGITEFRLVNGYAALWGPLSSGSVRLQRDALNLIQYLVHEHSSDCNIVTELRFHCIMMNLASSDDAEVREAALRGLLVLARNEKDGNSGQLVKNDDNLKQILEKLMEGISAMAPEDLGSAREEIQLVDSLWNACYNEPSSLGEKGLLVLPGQDTPVPDVASKSFEPPLRALAAAEAADGNSSLGEKGLHVLPVEEDAPAPDVASKLFEPPPRAWDAAAEAADGKSVSEKKDCSIVTELGLPCIMIHLAASDDARVREAALRGLLVLARDEDGNSGQLVKTDGKLKQVLQKLIGGISVMDPEDLGASREERQLVESLWNACYNDPSSIGDVAHVV